MQTYDLDIENYSYDDLLQLFKIDKSNILLEDELLDQINTVIATSKNSQSLFNFLNEAKNKIITFAVKPLKPSKIFPNSHSVFIPPIEPVKNIYNYKFPVGRENPIERRYIKKVICFDTIFRNNFRKSVATNCHFTLPKPVTNVISLKLISIDIPIMWPGFSSTLGNNKFLIKLYDVSGNDDLEYQVIIPDGNYTSETITFCLNNLLHNSGILGLDFLFFIVNPVTSRVNFRVKNATDVNPNDPYDPANPNYSPNFKWILDFQNNMPIYRTCGWMLGFRKLEYSISEDDSYTDNISSSSVSTIYYGYLESESSYGSSIYDYIFLDVDDFNNNFITDTFTSICKNSYIGNNILARIPITQSHFNILNNNSADNIFKQRDYFGPVRIDKVDIKILNKFGEIVNLQNNNFSFALEFTILYSS